MRLRILCMLAIAVAACFEVTGCEPEPGIELGVSAAFGGVSGGWVVRAGGCNFPENALEADSKKRYYRGIYVLNPNAPQGEWRHVGNLPECIAYGASATTRQGVVMVGGVANGASAGALTGEAASAEVDVLAAQRDFLYLVAGRGSTLKKLPGESVGVAARAKTCGNNQYFLFHNRGC